MSKEKMSIEKKTKLIYSGELLFFAIVFIVIATLEILGVIGKRHIVLVIFNWVTIFGGTWMLVDFFWVLFSQRRRKKNSLIDKGLLIPLGIYFIIFDILCFCNLSFISDEFRRLMMGIAFYYCAAIYIFQGIYHYYHPIPSIIVAIEEAEKAEQEEMQEGKIEDIENKEIEEPTEAKEEKSE